MGGLDPTGEGLAPGNLPAHPPPSCPGHEDGHPSRQLSPAPGERAGGRGAGREQLETAGAPAARTRRDPGPRRAQPGRLAWARGHLLPPSITTPPDSCCASSPRRGWSRTRKQKWLWPRVPSKVRSLEGGSAQQDRSPRPLPATSRLQNSPGLAQVLAATSRSRASRGRADAHPSRLVSRKENLSFHCDKCDLKHTQAWETEHIRLKPYSD